MGTTPRRPLAVLLAAACILLALPGTPAAQAALPAAPTVNNSTRAGALAAYRSYNQAAAAIPAAGPDGSPAASPVHRPPTPGRPS